MQINGTDIFLGAYAERRKNSNQLEQKALSVSKEKAEAHIAGIKEALDSLNFQSRGVKVSVSEEDMKFLCSEEGFQKMKQDAEDLYMKNRNQQKVIAQGRDQGDLFWNNTGNQWMVFSEMLYKNGFYAGMDDEEVKQFEDTLASLTFGMDCLSRSQYLTGITFSSVQEEYKFFMSSGEAATELESSAAALRYLSDQLLPEEQKEGFCKLIDMYYEHNNEVLSEYSNPMESFNKVIAGINAQKRSDSPLLDEVAKIPVSEYKYTVQLGMINKSEQEKKQYRQDLQKLFDELGNNGNNTYVWEKIKDCFQKYATNGSEDGAFNNYVYDQAQYLFSHMKNCWGKLLGFDWP